MSQNPPRTTSVVTQQTPAQGGRRLIATQGHIARRQEILQGPPSLEQLQRLQGHIQEAAQSVNSLPLLGGVYFPNVAFTANVALTFQHGLQSAASFLICRPRTVGYFSEIFEVSQPRAGVSVLESFANVTADVWFFPQPSPLPYSASAAFGGAPSAGGAGGGGTGGGGGGSTPTPTPTPVPTPSAVTWAADLAGSTDLAQYVASISGPAGIGGPVPMHASSFQFDAYQNAPGFEQDLTGSQYANPAIFYAQQSSDPAGIPGDIRFVMGNPNGAAFPLVRWCLGHKDLTIMAVGANGGTGSVALWLFEPDEPGDPYVSTNYTLQIAFNSMYVNNSFGGNIYTGNQSVGQIVTAHVCGTMSLYLGLGASVPGPERGTFVITNVLTPPSGATPPVGGCEIYSQGGHPFSIASSGLITQLDNQGGISQLTNDVLAGPGTGSQVATVVAMTGSAGIWRLKRTATQMALQIDDGTGSVLLPDALNYPAKAADTQARSIQVSAQHAWSGATVNTQGGTISIQGGASPAASDSGVIQIAGSDNTGGASPTAGNIIIQTGVRNTDRNLLQVVAKSVESSGRPWAWSVATQSLTGSTSITLSSAKYSLPIIQLTGTATAGVTTTVNFPNALGWWLVDFSQLTFGAGAIVVLASGTAITGNIVAATITLNKTIGTLLAFGGNLLSFTV